MTQHTIDRYTYDDDKIKHIMSELETYYTTYNVYKSIVVCSDDSDTWRLATNLSLREHSVCTLCEEDLVDDRDLYMQRLKEFEGTKHRILAVSYPMWRALKDHIEVYVLPEQNLVVFAGVTEEGVNEFKTWLVDAKRRGFITREDCYVINVDVE